MPRAARTDRHCLGLPAPTVIASAPRWIERYLAKYRPVGPGLDADFLQGNLVVEFEPERAFAVIEREDEFSTRATRWVFAT